MAAPQYAIVKLADEISFEEAARLGYLGTAYGALRKFGHIAGKSILINGISGTLGLSATTWWR
jgi:alcohol dehydrogenase